MTLFSFDVDEELTEHTSPFDAHVHLLEGTCSITIDGTQHTLAAGDMIILPAKIPHAVKSLSRFSMMLTIIKGE